MSPASAKEVRLFGFAPWVLARWEERLRAVLALDLRNIARVTPSVILSIVALCVVTAGGFAWAAIQAADGELGLGAATVLAQAMLAPLAHFGPTGQAVINLSLSSKPIRSLLELERTIHALPDPVGPSHNGGSAGESSIPVETIRFENVSFRYPGTDVDVLRDFSLEIPAGTSVAVVGLNGAGKTTLVKLLCRFYEPTEGRITVDGRDIRSFEPRKWQRHVAAIFQDFACYPFSARDNVGFGDLSSLTGAHRARGRARRRHPRHRGAAGRLGHCPEPRVHRRHRPVGRPVAADRARPGPTGRRLGRSHPHPRRARRQPRRARRSRPPWCSRWGTSAP